MSKYVNELRILRQTIPGPNRIKDLSQLVWAMLSKTLFKLYCIYQTYNNQIWKMNLFVKWIKYKTILQTDK